MSETAAQSLDLKSLSGPTRNQLLADFASNLSSSEKKDLARTLSLVPDPDPSTSNFLWRIVVSAFVLVMAGSFYVLARRVLSGIPKDSTDLFANPELILSVFNAVVGFLAGLFVQSPAK